MAILQENNLILVGFGDFYHRLLDSIGDVMRQALDAAEDGDSQQVS